MASVHGSYVEHWRAYIDYTATTNDTSVVVAASGIGMQSDGWNYAISSGINVSVTMQGSSWNPSASGGFGGTGKKNFIGSGSRTYTFRRGHSTYTAWVQAKVTNASGYHNGTSTAKLTVTVPKLDSWQVSYDANGGAGAPSAQTKWRGEALTLSKSKPTRDNHTFMGWSTSQGGPVAYQPGSSYAANAAATLYAVWQLDYIPPTITGLTVTRCDDGGNDSDTGTKARVAFSWTVDAASAQAVKALKVATSRRGSGAWTTTTLPTPSGTSGKVSKLLAGPFSPDSAYDVRVTITDASDGSVSATATMATAFFVLDVTADGHGMGVGCVAPTDGLSVAMDTDHTGALTVGGKAVLTEGAGDVADQHIDSNARNWSWVKFANGMCMAWIQIYRASYATTTKSGAACFYGPDIESTWPFKIYGPTVNVSVAQKVGIYLINLKNVDSSGFSCVVSRTSSNTQPITVHLQVFGRWK